MEEIWKAVIGGGGSYEVSDLGNVRSKDREVIGRHYEGRPLKPITSTKGYLKASISIEGKGGPKYIHRLIAAAFIPNPENLEQVNHINGDKQDNRLENLEWCSNSQNQKHSYARLGKSREGRVSGEKHYNSKFSDETIAAIRAKKGTGSTRAVGAEFNTSSSHISLIWNNKTRKQ